MKLSIRKCSVCEKTRLVDNVKDKWICFACKQRMNKKPGKEKNEKK